MFIAGHTTRVHSAIILRILFSLVTESGGCNCFAVYSVIWPHLQYHFGYGWYHRCRFLSARAYCKQQGTMRLYPRCAKSRYCHTHLNGFVAWSCWSKELTFARRRQLQCTFEYSESVSLPWQLTLVFADHARKRNSLDSYFCCAKQVRKYELKS